MAIAFALLASPDPTRGAPRPHSLISDGAVLQQGMDVPIWGTANPGEGIVVQFQGQEATAVADKGGRWLVQLKPLKPGGPFDMTIAGEGTLTIRDLLVGEVWVCSGQSNMAMQLYVAANGKEASKGAADPLLRLCTVRPPASAPAPLEDVGVSWTGSVNAGAFSAVGYFFARDLRKALGVPVGMIHASVGATSIGWWMNREAWDDCPARKAEVENELKANTSKLYNGMIAPLQPYAVRGVVWYQGESDSPNPERYREIFPAMIRGWRKAWGQGEFPFLFVQAASNDRWPPELREAQLLSWLGTPRTAMVVATDCGDPVEIHPPRKEPIGARLALAARAIAYGERLEHSGPVFEAMTIEAGRASLSFTHVGGGLEARGGDLRGFTIAGADMKFVPGSAKIVDDRVLVSAPAVSNPVAVRFAWANSPDVNFFNKAGLPASPFRTDAPGLPALGKPAQTSPSP